MGDVVNTDGAEERRVRRARDELPVATSQQRNMVLAVLLIGIGFFASLASAVTALFVGTFLIGFVIAPVARVGLLHCTNELLTVRSLIRELNETIDRCADVDLP